MRLFTSLVREFFLRQTKSLYSQIFAARRRRTRVGKKFLTVCALFIMHNLIFSGTGAHALQDDYNENKYTFKKSTKRIALIVGNSNYKNFDEIPSSAYDIESMKYLLVNHLSFEEEDIVYVHDENDAENFNYVDFDRFVKRIDEGDFVFFYFSGHGLTYAGEGFLVPTGAPRPIMEKKIMNELMSLSTIRERIGSRKPGLAVIVLDSCRNISNVVIRNELGEDVIIEKGLPRPTGESSDMIVAYATQPNKISAGLGDYGRNSIYTEQFIALAAKGEFNNEKIEDFLKEVRLQVRMKTEYFPEPQIPMLEVSSSSYARLIDTLEYLKLQETDWLSALKTRDRRNVLIFLAHHGTSRYAAAARLWLAENRNAPPPSSKVSAESVEAAWGDQSGKPVNVARIDGPYALQRRIKTSADRLEANSPSGELARKSEGSERGARIIADVGTAVLSTAVKARNEPSAASEPATTLSAGTTVAISGVKKGPKGEPWLEFANPVSEGGAVAYLPASRIALKITSIGVPLKEVIVSYDPRLITLVDSDTIVQAFQELRKEGRSISRVSLSVPPVRAAATELGTHEAENQNSKKMIYAARLAHATYVLEKAGVDRRSVTSVMDNPDVADDHLSVKFFGK